MTPAESKRKQRVEKPRKPKLKKETVKDLEPKEGDRQVKGGVRASYWGCFGRAFPSYWGCNG